MIRLTSGFLLAWVIPCCATPTIEADEKPTVRVEFRRAEDKPGEGLTETTVEGTDRKIYLHQAADLTHEDIAEAKGNVLEDKSLAIALLFTAEGKKKMETVSREHQNRPLAIVIDGKVVSAPVLRSVISERALITGTFTREEIDRIVSGLNRP